MGERVKNVRRGTYHVVLWRPSFVVLGSDTAALRDDTAAHVGYTSKILCHDKLPLAVGIGGLAEFATDTTETNVPEMIRTEFRVWEAQGRITIHTIAKWAEAVLLPRIQEAKRADPTMKLFSWLIVATCYGGNADSVKIVTNDTVTYDYETLNRTYILPTATLYEWCKTRYGTQNGDPLGMKLHDQLTLAAHARTMISDAIAAEKRLAKEGPLLCGGHAEVVIVDSTGARLVSETPRQGQPSRARRPGSRDR